MTIGVAMVLMGTFVGCQAKMRVLLTLEDEVVTETGTR